MGLTLPRPKDRSSDSRPGALCFWTQGISHPPAGLQISPSLNPCTCAAPPGPNAPPLPLPFPRPARGIITIDLLYRSSELTGSHPPPFSSRSPPANSSSFLRTGEAAGRPTLIFPCPLTPPHGPRRFSSVTRSMRTLFSAAFSFAVGLVGFTLSLPFRFEVFRVNLKAAYIPERIPPGQRGTLQSL